MFLFVVLLLWGMLVCGCVGCCGFWCDASMFLLLVCLFGCSVCWWVGSLALVGGGFWLFCFLVGLVVLLLVVLLVLCLFVVLVLVLGGVLLLLVCLGDVVCLGV
ncbi:hypothetical protein [Neisseria sp. P0019.S002]|uniref:hypothetical protein n=1 Tax=Neisseria sp. P0019.S002 TaxID=3436798 RepID=UPI003F7E0664